MVNPQASSHEHQRHRQNHQRFQTQQKHHHSDEISADGTEAAAALPTQRASPTQSSPEPEAMDALFSTPSSYAWNRTTRPMLEQLSFPTYFNHQLQEFQVMKPQLDLGLGLHGNGINEQGEVSHSGEKGKISGEDEEHLTPSPLTSNPEEWDARSPQPCSPPSSGVQLPSRDQGMEPLDSQEEREEREERKERDAMAENTGDEVVEELEEKQTNREKMTVSHPDSISDLSCGTGWPVRSHLMSAVSNPSVVINDTIARQEPPPTSSPEPQEQHHLIHPKKKPEGVPILKHISTEALARDEKRTSTWLLSNPATPAARFVYARVNGDAERAVKKRTVQIVTAEESESEVVVVYDEPPYRAGRKPRLRSAQLKEPKQQREQERKERMEVERLQARLDRRQARQKVKSDAEKRKNETRKAKTKGRRDMTEDKHDLSNKSLQLSKLQTADPVVNDYDGDSDSNRDSDADADAGLYPKNRTQIDTRLKRRTATVAAAASENATTEEDCTLPYIIAEHYTNLIADEATLNLSATCTSCLISIRGRTTVTSNFIQHIRNRHPKIYDEYRMKCPMKTRK